MSDSTLLIYEADDTVLSDIENYITSRGYKVKKVQKQDEKKNKRFIEFGDFYKFDRKTKEVFYHDKKIKLTRKEAFCLNLFLENKGHIVTFGKAKKYIWNKEESVTENNFRTLVWRLRNKLDGDLIRNNQGIGYYIDNN